jgi:hypothetical protein
MHHGITGSVVCFLANFKSVVLPECGQRKILVGKKSVFASYIFVLDTVFYGSLKIANF